MLIPQSLFKVLEYDAVFTVTPTSRFDHESDTVLAAIEMLVENDQPDVIEFPFAVLTTDSGDGAESADSVTPNVLNGSRPVELTDGEVDEVALAEVMVQQAQGAGITDPNQLEEVREWARSALAMAERVKVGRTRIEPQEKRRIILQQRLRVKPIEGRYVFETIAPPPASTLAVGGRVSVVVLLPWEDEDIRPQILAGAGETTAEFEFEQGRIKQRPWVAWHWKNDPLFRLVYQYG